MHFGKFDFHLYIISRDTPQDESGEANSLAEVAALLRTSCCHDRILYQNNKIVKNYLALCLLHLYYSASHFFMLISK